MWCLVILIGIGLEMGWENEEVEYLGTSSLQCDNGFDDSYTTFFFVNCEIERWFCDKLFSSDL